MKILYIVRHAPISPRYRGGSGVFYEQLASLKALGHDIHLWHYAKHNKRENFNTVIANDPEIWEQVKSWCSSIHFTTLPEKFSVADLIQSKLRHWAAKDDVVWPLLRVALLPELQKLVKSIKPDVVWAQTFWPAQVAVLQNDAPVVFSHLDWIHRIKDLRTGGQGNSRMKQAEHRVVAQASAIISGSIVEIADLKKLNNNVHNIPIAYEKVDLDFNRDPSDGCRIVHFGGTATTANRLGLERFYDVVWPEIRHLSPDFYMVGGLDGATPKLHEFFEQVTCTGHVTQWDTVLRPYDIQIIPWEESTGQRTRVPVALNYGQVLVAARGGVAGFSELKDGENCRLVERLEDMGQVLNELTNNAAERERIGRNARATFEKHFTRDGLLSAYEGVIRSVQ